MRTAFAWAATIFQPIPPSTKEQVMKAICISVAAAGVLVLAACGGTTPTAQNSGTGAPASSSAAGSTSAHNPCALVTAAQIEPINGGSGLTSSSTPNGTTCNWTDPTNAVDTAEVAVLPFSGTPTAAQLQTAVTNALGGATGGNGTPVSGIGSVALKAIAAVSATYAFAVNNSVVIIAVFSQSNPGSAMDTQVQALAQSVAGQI
jgi:Protein of unknown function (DUF3558)